MSSFVDKRLLILPFLLCLAGMVFAAEIEFAPPHFTGSGPYVSELNMLLEDIFIDFRREIDDILGGIDNFPDKLIGAFASSSVFASDGASQRGYRGYENFAFTLGSMAGVQIPMSPFNIVGELENIVDNLQTDGDIRFGANPQILNAQIGINTSKFFLKNLYLGAKFGFMRLNIPQGFSFGTMSAGLMANYQLVNQKRLAAGAILWRGLSLGTGFVWQNSNLGLSIDLELDDSIQTINVLGERVVMEVIPKLRADFTVNTFTIPIEAITSIRLLYFLNIALGAGVDIGFGNASLLASGSAEVNLSLPQNFGLRQDRPARMRVGMGGKTAPDISSPKIMSGLGFNFGPVLIDIPVTYYFLNHGLSAGITFGVVF